MKKVFSFSEKVIAVFVDSQFMTELDQAEFLDLVKGTGAEVMAVHKVKLGLQPKYLIGKGKVEELAQEIEQEKIKVAIFSHDLTPSQQRNLEQVFKCRVLDRTGLILDIFARRAESFEGKLQVELAQLEHLSTRLVRGWTHLERQKGGIGLRGPGETQLETDRRLLANRVKTIKSRLRKVHKQRAENRKQRIKSHMPLVALVGYTNAGKSTLFKALTGESAYVADQLFATLDTTLRRMELPHFGPIIVSDTVGFIKDLPHSLVDSFHATLEEVLYADLLVHVVDATASLNDHLAAVHAVLTELGVEETPMITVYNKADLLECEPEDLKKGWPDKVLLSAKKGQGLVRLKAAVLEKLSGKMTRGWFCIPFDKAGIRAKLFAFDAIVQEKETENGWLIYIMVPEDKLLEIFAGCDPETFQSKDTALLDEG